MRREGFIMTPKPLSKEEMIRLGILKEGVKKTSSNSKPIIVDDFKKHQQAVETYKQQTGVYDPSEPEGSRR